MIRQVYGNAARNFIVKADWLKGTTALARRPMAAARSGAAFAVVSMVPLQVQAADYLVANEAELRAAISAANADGDASATITLTGNVVVADPTAFPAFTKPVTIDTGAFTLSGENFPGGAGSAGTSLSFLGGPLLANGAFNGGAGGDVAGAGTTGGAGGIGLSLSNGTVDNSAVVTGGAGGNTTGLTTVGGAGGVGMSLTDSDLINRNAIIGGAGGDTDAQNLNGQGTETTAGAGATGLVMNGGNLDNQGTITGGAGGDILNIPGDVDQLFAGDGGIGASLTGGTHVNSGTIMGAQGGIGSNIPGSGHGNGGDGLVLADASIVNDGDILGGICERAAAPAVAAPAGAVSASVRRTARSSITARSEAGAARRA